MAGTTTAQSVLNTALGYMDEVGSTEYNTNALLIINSLCGELYPLSDTYTVATVGARPIVPILTALSDAITSIDDVLARTVMPHGLAAELLLLDGENGKASFRRQTYEELKRKFGKDICFSFSKDIDTDEIALTFCDALNIQSFKIEDVYNAYYNN